MSNIPLIIIVFSEKVPAGNLDANQLILTNGVLNSKVKMVQPMVDNMEQTLLQKRTLQQIREIKPNSKQRKVLSAHVKIPNKVSHGKCTD